MNTTTWINHQPNPSIGISDQINGTMLVRYDDIGRNWYVYIPEGRMITQGHATREEAKTAAERWAA
jgi:hypothetical protein